MIEEKFGSHDLAWLSGFWDGEGSVGIVKNKNTRILGCQLSHTEFDSVKRILAIMEFFNISGRGYTYQERDPLKHRDAHYIRVNGINNVLQFAKLMLPYAVTKKRHWEIAIEWAESRIETAGGINEKGHLSKKRDTKQRGYSEKELQLAEELSKLNKRGPSDRAERKKGRIE